jgi:hypothetical protein
MKKIIFGFVLIFVICPAVMAAPLLSEFPLGMTQKEATAKGLIVRDQQGGVVAAMFGGKEWPAAMVFENDKLVYIILKGSGDEFSTAADYGILQLGWVVINAATENNLVFDALNLVFSGMDADAIDIEYEKFQEIMQTQKYTNYTATYMSYRVFVALLQLKNEKPIDKYPDATICNLTVNGSDTTVVFTTFGYMDKMKKQSTK